MKKTLPKHKKKDNNYEKIYANFDIILSILYQ